MSRTFHSTIGTAAAAAALAVGLSAGGAGAAVRSPQVRAALPSPPDLKATVSKKGLTLSGPRTFAPGRITLSLKSVGNERTIELVSFKPGFTFSQLRADLAAFGASEGPNGPSKTGISKLDDAINHTTLYGGLDADAGQTLTASMVLPRAGTYYVYNDSGNLPTQARLLTVAGPAVTRSRPRSLATVIAKTDFRFGGPRTLPAKGTITFRNKSTESPHILDLFQVKAGTTRRQILNFLHSNSNAPPSFGLSGSADTDAVSPGHAQTLTYSVPKGEYVELCFFPDPKTGIPHALMGMFRIVHLK
jgi:hypothetical protein